MLRQIALRNAETGSDSASGTCAGAGAPARHAPEGAPTDGEDRMRANTQWLSEAEKSRIVDQAMELLAGVGMRFAGSAVLPELAARGARGRRGDRASRACRASSSSGRSRSARGRVLFAGPPRRTTSSWTRASPSTSRPAAASPRRSTSAPASAARARCRTCARPRRSTTNCRSSTSCGHRSARRTCRSSSVSSSSTSRCSPRRASTSPSSTRRATRPPSAASARRWPATWSASAQRPRISTVLTAASPLQIDGRPSTSTSRWRGTACRSTSTR